MFVSAAALIVGGLLVGARPGAFEAAQRTAAAFADREVYAAAVLGRPLPSAEPSSTSMSPRSPSASPSSPCSPRWRCAPSCSSGRGCRSPSRPRSSAATNAGVFRLRRLHSGQIGDYVAWATVGFALLGALIAVAT